MSNKAESVVKKLIFILEFRRVLGHYRENYRENLSGPHKIWTVHECLGRYFIYFEFEYNYSYIYTDVYIQITDC